MYVGIVFAYRACICVRRCICVGMGIAVEVLGGMWLCGSLQCVLSGYVYQCVRRSWGLSCAQLFWQAFANKGLTQPEICAVAA